MFFRKKKPAIPTKNEIQEILRDTLAALPRTEGAEVSVGFTRLDSFPCAFIDKPGRTLREDLGGDGAVALIYDAEEKELSLRLTYCYAKHSGEMELLANCLQSFVDVEEDALPGDICGFSIAHFTDAPKTNVSLLSFGVEPTELQDCAARFCDFANDWLDTNHEIFEDMLGSKEGREYWAGLAAAKKAACDILVETLSIHPRLENALVKDCFLNSGFAPMAKAETLGPTLCEDLGGDGEVSLSYDPASLTLSLTLQYTYPLDSEEMKFILDQLHLFEDEEDEDEALRLPGSIDHVNILRYTVDDLAEVSFISEQVVPSDLKSAAARLLDRVNDWLDTTYELMEDLC